MKPLVRIYLSGKMTGITFQEAYDWRRNLQEAIEKIAEDNSRKIEVINPVDYYNAILQETEKVVMDYNIRKVKSCDLVIVNLEGLNESIRSIMECYTAYSIGIPVIALGSNQLFESLHPWVKCCIIKHDVTSLGCIDYVKHFYIL